MEPKSVDGILASKPVGNNQDPQEQKPVNDPNQIPDAAENTIPDVAQEIQKSEEKVDSTIDEYGNPLNQQQKTYTEEEVNRMMRDRNSRGKWKEQHQEQQHQPQHQVDVNGDEPWDVTLQKYVDNAIENKQRRYQEEEWRRQQDVMQSEFENKFTSGMNKYTDFRDVVKGKNITDSMLLATRHLDNPAAFIYGAAKMHPQEIDRISKISDPYIQAAEVGRLHERMVKSKNLVSSAPKPIDIQKGDMPIKDYTRPGIDQLIHQHAISKRK